MNEKITVDKILSIIGESKTNTTIQPPTGDPGTVITISASWVNVTGFTIRNGGGGNAYWVWLESTSDNNCIRECNINNNTQYGLKNNDENIMIDATYNYWGHPDGPSTNRNPNNGDWIYGNVIYSPSLVAPVEEAGPQ